MPIDVMDVINAQYRTTKAADAQCGELLRRLGYSVRYLAARLAIARSLSQNDLPEPLGAGDEDDMASAIRGLQLFGDGGDPKAWMALIVQRSGQADLSRKDFQGIVAAHWRRGAGLLAKDWEEAEENLGAFVMRLADLARLPAESAERPLGFGDREPGFTLDANVVLPVGPVAEDAETGEPVEFPVNAPGGSPHMAIMGGTNSGKTYTAITMLKRLRVFGPVPILAFDFKGDLSEKLAPDLGAKVISPPRTPVPLDVLAVSQDDDVGKREAASRIRESIGRVKNTKLSGVQLDALRAAIQQVLRTKTDDKPALIGDIARALSTEYKRMNRKPDELTATLNELTQFTLFDPKMDPDEFFKSSWIIRLPQDSTAEVRRLIINLTLDSLDRWLNSQPDAPVVDGRRALRHVTMLDEAHVILQTKLPALSNLIRMSRSKGGVIMLVSQSPDDFEGEDEGFLDNMGLTLAFNTQAKAGPTRRVFGSGASLTDLNVGEALCRIRSEAKTRRIIAWRA
jgi:hypothetical protein